MCGYLMGRASSHGGGKEGIVKLPNAAREEAEIPLRWLCGVAEFGDLVPYDHRLGTKRSIVG